MGKFDLARKLKRRIKTIRNEYETDLVDDEEYFRQVATAVYLIDRFALRVGNEKGEGETDTVGVTSLRIEHIDELGDNRIKFDFLGLYKHKPS